MLSCTLRSRQRSTLTKRKFESQQLFQDANPVSLRLQDVVLENDKNAPPKTFRTRRIHSNTMNSAGGSHLGSSSEGGIKAEQEQKPQRVANTTNNFTPIKELIANYKGLLQSGHKNKQGAFVFAHCSRKRVQLEAFSAHIQSRIIVNVGKLRSKLKGLRCNSMWSGAFFEAARATQDHTTHPECGIYKMAKA